MPDPVVLFAMVILLVPMGYFLLAAPAFLFVRLDIPPVTVLLRGMFKAYFLVLATTAVIGAIAFLLEGRFVVALGVGVIAAAAILVHPRFLQQMDAELSARDAGDRDAVRRLRGLHWAGMLCNAIALAAVVISIPYIAAAPA